MNPGADELVKVLVPRDYDRFQTRFLSLNGQGPDDVIGFVPVHLHHRIVEPLHQLSHSRQASGQLVGHLFPCRLVLGVHLLTLAHPLVEYDRQIIRAVVLPYREKKIGKAEGG
jgi:hypothetical protein